MRRMALLLAAFGLIVRAAPADEPVKLGNPVVPTPEFILRVERLQEAQPAKRPLTVEFYVRPGDPLRCELTVGMESFGCRGLIRRLTDGKVWLSLEPYYSKADAEPAFRRTASVRGLVELGKPISAEWTETERSSADEDRSRGQSSARDGVRLTLVEARDSIKQALKPNFEHHQQALPDDPKPDEGAVAITGAGRARHAVRKTKTGFIGERDADLPAPPEDLLYQFEIEVARPGWFYGKGVFGNSRILIAGRLDAPKGDGTINILAVQEIVEEEGVVHHRSNGIREGEMTRNVPFLDGRGRTTQKFGDDKPKLLSTYTEFLLVKTLPSDDDDS